MNATAGGSAASTVLLTGATGGIGRALVSRLASAGHEIVVIARREGMLAEVAEGAGAIPIPGDLTDPGFIEELPDRLPSAWGGAPRVLVNNAGAFDLAPVQETDLRTFERHLAVNLVAPFRLVRTFLPIMLERGAGHIVNVGSVAGRRALPGNAAYSASKFGLRGLHGVLGAELQSTRIRATWIEPSAVDTPLWDPLDPDRRPDLPSREDMLRPEAVADAIHFAIAQPPEVTIQEIALRAGGDEGEDG